LIARHTISIPLGTHYFPKAGVPLNQPATINSDIHVLEQLLAIGRRRWLVVALLALLGGILGYVYALSQVPVYASSATVMVRSGPAIDPLRQGIESSTPEEEGQFLSQLELARSSSVAQVVANQLGLAEDPAFASNGTSRLERLLGRLVGRAAAKPASLSEQAVITRLQNNIKVLRVGRTYVAALSYSHADPAVAQKVAQAFAEAYKSKMAQETDVANSRLRATLQSEIDRATGPQKDMLQAIARQTMLSRVLPGMDVIVINDAKLPGATVAPRTSFLVAVGLLLGAVIGCAIAGFRELTDRGVRDGDALARLVGTRFLGYLPRRALRTATSTRLGDGQPLPDAARRAALEPHSVVGETIRAMGVSLLGATGTGGGKIVGVTSVLPGEGTAVLAANLASHLASLGRNVLLVDADSRDARLSKWLANGAEQGVVDALLRDKPLDETVLYDSRTNLSLLPLVTEANQSIEPSGLFASARAKAFFETLSAQYDHVIIDLSPLAVSSDARAAAQHADSFLLAAEWGRVTPQLVSDLLDAEPEVRAKLLGLVLTKTDLKKLPLYAAAGSRASFQRRIGRG
jgi:Mrp family chromosome partitioning ATPase/capsular polysaccharide biosynthesis protein